MSTDSFNICFHIEERRMLKPLRAIFKDYSYRQHKKTLIKKNLLLKELTKYTEDKKIIQLMYMLSCSKELGILTPNPDYQWQVEAFSESNLIVDISIVSKSGTDSELYEALVLILSKISYGRDVNGLVYNAQILDKFIIKVENGQVSWD